MQLGQSITLKQTQRLNMTPQLRQALNLLRMNQQDLLGELREALDKNPLLQAEEDLPEPARHAARLVVQSDGPAGPEADIDALPAAPQSLADYLIAQIGMMQEDADLRVLAAHLVQELEPDGYLHSPLEDVASRLNRPQADLDAALRLIQSCEPAGVGARDLAECLALQLAEQGALDDADRAILARLDLVAAHDLAGLAAACGLEGEALAQRLARLRGLNPRPGAGYHEDSAPVVVPEILVRRDSFGQWLCEMNPETLPKISINQNYATALARGNAKKDTQSKHWMEQANWLLRALEQRAQNILKVARAIVEHQARFFEFGIEQMRPLSLRDIAEKTALHESTISRAVNGKFLTCRAGTFELRYFFTASLPSIDGEGQFGAAAIRARIKRLIDEENQKKPLSDDAIVKILRAGGVDIARRTIAKYREAMGISSSVQRRRQFSAAQRQEG